MGDIHFLTEAHLGVGEPQEDVVLLLENLLKEAKKGEIIGLCIASVRGNNSRVTDLAVGCASADSMLLAVISLENRVKNGYFSIRAEHPSLDRPT